MKTKIRATNFREDSLTRIAQMCDIRTHIALCGSSCGYVLGALPFAPVVCIDCASAIRGAISKPEHTIRHLLKADEQEIIETIRARLSAATLGKAPSDDEENAPI